MKPVDGLDWARVATDLDADGVAVAGPVLDADGCAAIAALYDDDARFRSTIDMARHRFGEGQYRYFATPLPDVVTELRAACWPHLLPIARDWADRTGQPAPWPDDARGVARDVPRRRPAAADPAAAALRRRATGTPCTATSTASSCSRCRS